MCDINAIISDGMSQASSDYIFTHYGYNKNEIAKARVDPKVREHIPQLIQDFERHLTFGTREAIIQAYILFGVLIQLHKDVGRVKKMFPQLQMQWRNLLLDVL